MVRHRLAAALVILAALVAIGFSARAGDRPRENPKGTGHITLYSPNITGAGPWEVTARGKISIDADSSGFVGVSASLGESSGLLVAAVSLPKGNPTPGGTAAEVEFTWPAVPTKGEFAVDVIIYYKDPDGRVKTTRTNVPSGIR
jgi:hypothetical protein